MLMEIIVHIYLFRRVRQCIQPGIDKRTRQLPASSSWLRFDKDHSNIRLRLQNSRMYVAHLIKCFNATTLLQLNNNLRQSRTFFL